MKREKNGQVRHALLMGDPGGGGDPRFRSRRSLSAEAALPTEPVHTAFSPILYVPIIIMEYGVE